MHSIGPSFLVVTEDASKRSFEVLTVLTKKSSKWISQGLKTNLLRFQPVEGREAGIAAIANGWKGKRAEAEHNRRSLVRAIATHLLEDRGVVLFHTDADRPWQEAASSENFDKFRTMIVEPVKSLIAMHVGPGKGATVAAAVIGRLVLVGPAYSVEAWLYQNTQDGRNLCRMHHANRHSDFFSAIEADRAMLDEIVQPKDSCCLFSKYNLELAREFPVEVAYLQCKSFTATVNRLLQVDILRWLREVSV